MIKAISRKAYNMTSTSKSWTIATTLAISLVIGGVIGGSVLIPVPANAQAGKADQMNADQYIQLVRRDLRQDKRRAMQFCHGDLSLPSRARVPATYGNGSVEVTSVIDRGRPDAVWSAACRA